MGVNKEMRRTSHPGHNIKIKVSSVHSSPFFMAIGSNVRLPDGEELNGTEGSMEDHTIASLRQYTGSVNISNITSRWFMVRI